MEWLNYHHLLYFHTVVREGGVSRAAEKLRLAQPTVSAQIHALEAALDEKLFSRSGRRLVLTDVGRMVYRYADEIFSLGREMMDTLRDRPTGRPMRVAIGVVDQVAKLVAYRLIAPALRLPEPVQILCREDRADRLLAELSVHGLDLVISDAPTPHDVKVKAFNHLLGECGVSFFAAPALAARLRRGFPASLTGAPMLLPSEGTVLRRRLDEWLAARGLRPAIAGEFDDSALLTAFGQAGTGVFAAPAAVEREVCAGHGVRIVGRDQALRERYYAISIERRITHPALRAISSAARDSMFRERGRPADRLTSRPADQLTSRPADRPTS